MADEESNQRVGTDVTSNVAIYSDDLTDILTINEKECTPTEQQIKQLTSEETLQAWLETNSLAMYFNNMKKNGLTCISHLEDITEGDAQSDLGMTKFQARRLLRLFNDWKAQRSHEKKGKVQQSTSFPALVTNDKAVVVHLPPAFQGFVGTRDGEKSVVVPTQTLAKKWKNLYYNNPLNPFQKISNNFVLTMCEPHQHNFKSLRECEQWARQERDVRITILLALEKNTKGWTPYYKKKSIYGVLSTLQEKHPLVAALNTESVRKIDYESCVEFKEDIENLSTIIKKHQETVDKAVADTLLPSGSVKSGDNFT